MFVVLSMFVGGAATVGPGRAIDWVVAYLIPVVVVLCVVIAVLALLTWALKRLPASPYRDRWQ
jgi:protein-S-isoprenylcysteine O-methyltransferase Ste14